MKYNVIVKVPGYFDAEVKASDMEDALDKAYDKVYDTLKDNVKIRDMSLDSVSFEED